MNWRYVKENVNTVVAKLQAAYFAVSSVCGIRKYNPFIKLAFNS